VCYISDTFKYGFIVLFRSEHIQNTMICWSDLYATIIKTMSQCDTYVMQFITNRSHLSSNIMIFLEKKYIPNNEIQNLG